jgi:spermidine synthase
MSEKNLQRLVLLAFCFSGAAALSYEVVWTRALSFILGSTVYALSTILATFMAGLALGAYLGGKLADRKEDLLLYFGLCELGIGLFGFGVVTLIYRLPPLYFALYQALHLNASVFYVVQFVLSAAVMIIPTTLMGATFPLVSKRLTHNMGEMGRKVGDAYSANTFGAILGSLGAGFLLVPGLGLTWASFAAGTLNVLAGLGVIVLSRKRFPVRYVALGVAVAGAGLLLAATASHGTPLATFYRVFMYGDFDELRAASGGKKVLLKKDYAQGHLIAYEVGYGLVTLQHGGKMEGTSPVDIPNTVRLATVPAAAFAEPAEDVLIVGLGAGVTTWAAGEVSQNVEVSEIHPGVVDVVREHGLPGALDGVKIHVTDARTQLFYNEKLYDFISSEPSVPSEAMAGNLFTREFYEIAASRLKPGGVMAQWLPAWILTVKDARAAIKTFASVFDHVYLWRVLTSNDYLLLGSKGPFRYSPAEIDRRSMEMVRRIIPEQWVTEMVSQGVNLEEFFTVDLIRDDRSVPEIVAMEDIPVITDDKPLLEFLITKNLLLGRGFDEHRR